MRDVTHDNFGLLIAYLVPGATVLLGLSHFSPTLQTWFAGSANTPPTLGGFLYLTVASVAIGMVVSALRWALVDTAHAWTGLSLPPLNFSRLGQNVEAYRLLIEIHYHHYQFHANMLVATAIAYVAYRVRLADLGDWSWIDPGILGLEIVFLATSRDTLRKYYTRTHQLLDAENARSGATRTRRRVTQR